MNNNLKEKMELIEDPEQLYTDLPEEEPVTSDRFFIIESHYDDPEIRIDYFMKHITKTTVNTDKKSGKQYETTNLILKAIPIDLVVFNDNIKNSGRSYSCTWEFEDGYKLELTGDITFHTNSLLKTGAVLRKSNLQDIISTVFSKLSYTKARGTQVFNTPKEKGFYYDFEKEEIITVDHTIITPTYEQKLEALELLEEYSLYFGKWVYNKETGAYIETEEGITPTFVRDATRLAVFLRWCLNAPFHYVRKQLGMTNDNYIFLSGESGVGKTYGYVKAGLYITGVEDIDKLITSGASNSKAQISKNLAKSTFPVFIDEGDKIFNEDHLTSMLKHSVQSLTSRELTDMETQELKKERALAPLGFSANNVFKDTEKGALTNRVIVLPFYSEDIPHPRQKEEFRKTFNIDYKPQDRRRKLKYIGYAFQEYIISNPTVYINTNPDNVVKEFLINLCKEVDYVAPLEWVTNDIKTKTSEEERLERNENLKEIIKSLLIKELKVTPVKYNEEGYATTTLLEDPIDWKEKLILLAEYNKISWFKTTKRKKHIILTSGILRAIKKEDPTININNMEELTDILINCGYSYLSPDRYSYSVEGKVKQAKNSLKVNVEDLSNLFELEEDPKEEVDPEEETPETD